jgi:diguanylate cyclase
MSAETHIPVPGKSALSRWFGIRHTSSHVEDEGNAPAGTAPAPVRLSLEEGAQRDLLEQITIFLLEYRLVVTPNNLLAAHAAFSGTNPRLARKIAQIRNEGAPVTQRWLDEMTSGEATDADRRAEIDQLMAKLQSGVEVFSTTTQRARDATGEYQEALTLQVSQIERTDAAGRVLTSLADIAKAMLERTQQVEGEMRRCEREATTLRKSLARAQREATIDHLTGLPNRRAFEASLDRHYREAKAAIEPLTIAFCDIDKFKLINDTHGHETGDRVIQAIGHMLALISNENCHVARHGGEEFVVLFRNATKQEALTKLNAVREQMANRHFVNRNTDKPIGMITFSGGIADVFAYPNPRDALEAADKALYRAKQEGRNQILLADA